MKRLQSSRFGSLAFLLFLVGPAGHAQSVETVLSQGDPFPNPNPSTTVGGFHDIAVGDGGEWLAAVDTFPALGTPLSVISAVLGTQSVFTPGAVANLNGVTSTLINELTLGDYSQSGFTITIVTGVPHGLVSGVPVRLDFLNSTGGTPPADGTFTASVIDPFSFTVTHGTSSACGTLLAPCGTVELERTIQPVDLDYSLTCVPNYQGVLQMADVSAAAPTITPTIDDTGLFWNSTVIVREGGPCGAPQVGAGTTYTRIWRSAVDSRQDYLVLARLNDPFVPGVEDALVKVDVSGSCPPTLVAEKVLVREGNTILNTGGSKFTGFYSLQKRSFALNDRGDFMYVPTLEDDGFPSLEHPIVLNNRAVLTEFNQVPGPGASGTMVQFQLATIDLNDLGDYVAQVRVQTTPHPIDCDPGPLVVYCTPYGEAIVKGNADVGSPKKFIQTGDAFPDPTLAGMGNEKILRIGARREIQSESPRMVFPVFITNGGDVLWYGEWGHLESGFEVTVGRGVFFNKKLIAQVGDALSGPTDLLLEFGLADTEVRSAMEVSRNGRYLLFYGLRGDASSQTPSLFRIDLGESATYGTVAQAAGVAGCPSGFPACTFAYPTPSLDCTPGLPLPGAPTTLGDFPLLGHNLQAIATSAPAGTVAVQFAFKSSVPSNFPCGCFQGTFPFEVLLGSGSSSNFTVPFTGGSALYQTFLPPSALSLIGTAYYCQAYFKDASVPAQTIGASNGIRYVIGAQ